MTTRLFYFFILVFASLPARATSASAAVTCQNMKQMCSVTYNYYQLQAAACQNQFKNFNCGEYRSSAELKHYVKSCTPEAVCIETEIANDFGSVARSCTGITPEKIASATENVMACAKSLTCMTMVPGAMLSGIASGIYGFFKAEHDVVYSFVANTGEAALQTVAGAQEYNRRWQCLDAEYRIGFSCRLYGGTLSAITMAEIAKRAPGVIREGVASVVAASRDANLAFVRSMVKKQFTTLAQRQAYVKLALQTKSDGRTMFLDIQNSSMKTLNDTLGDKNLVTALTNRRLEMTFENLQALKKKYPHVEMMTYDDFKSGRIAFRSTTGRLPSGFEKDVRAMVAQTNHEFAVEVESKGLIPNGAKVPPPDTWFTAGWGATGDQANTAARYARRSASEQNVVRGFGEAMVQTNLASGLRNTERLRAGLTQTTLKNTSLLEKGADGKLVPSMDVFEAYRKTSSARELAQSLTERTGHPVSTQMAQSLRTYIASVDELAPSIHIVEARQIVSFTGSKANGVMVDVTSMGALNLSQEAQALAKGGSVADAVVRSREGEQAATQIFETNKTAIVGAGSDALGQMGVKFKVLVSGDDILFQPDRALKPDEMRRLQESIAQSASTANVRLSAVAPKVRNANIVGVRGELLEKKTRSLTLQSIPDQKGYTLMVVSDAKGAPRLSVVSRTGGSVDPAVEASFQDAFAQALKIK